MVGGLTENNMVIQGWKFVSFCLHSVPDSETEWRQNGDK